MSLLAFNRQSTLDITALYFFGAYGLGMLAFWTTQLTIPRERLLWHGLLILTWGAALWVDFRARVALAGGVALALIWLQCQSLALTGWWSEAWRNAMAPLVWLGQRSYSGFLIHFPVCLVFNATLARYFPAQLLPNAVGMVAAFAASLASGACLYRRVEIRTRNKTGGLHRLSGLPG